MIEALKSYYHKWTLTKTFWNTLYNKTSLSEVDRCQYEFWTVDSKLIPLTIFLCRVNIQLNQTFQNFIFFSKTLCNKDGYYSIIFITKVNCIEIIYVFAQFLRHRVKYRALCRKMQSNKKENFQQ